MSDPRDPEDWTDLNGAIVHVHSAPMNWKKAPYLPVRCRGFAFMFPEDKHATMVSIMPLTASHEENSGHKTQLLKTIALREPIRRAKAMRVRNFRIKMQLKEDAIDESCPGYAEMMAEINQSKSELGIEFIFVKQRRKKTMSANELEVHYRAEHAARLIFNASGFPEEWLKADIINEVAQQPFLPGCFYINDQIVKESPIILEETLGWKIEARTHEIYALLGFPILPVVQVPEIIEENDDEDDDNSSQRKRRSSGPPDDVPPKKTSKDEVKEECA